jgi:hypothetical protein
VCGGSRRTHGECGVATSGGADVVCPMDLVLFQRALEQDMVDTVQASLSAMDQASAD